MPRLFALAALLAVSACQSSPTAPPAEVHDLRLRATGTGLPTLSGVLVNTSDRPVTSADVFVTLYDGDNAVLEDVMVTVRGLAAGDSARFSRVLDVPATAVKLKTVAAR